MSVEFLSFFLILFAGLFFSGIFNRFHLPWVAALIVTGVVLGPYGTGVLKLNGAIEFIGEIGLVFLMFMAGLETKISSLKENKKNIGILALTIGVFSFFTGFFVSSYFGYPYNTSILLGVIFISSSVAVVIPSLQANGLFKTQIGKTIVGVAVTVDILSLVLLSVLLQKINPITEIPLPLFYLLLLVSLIFLKFIMPKVHNWLRYLSSKKDVFERELRLAFAIMIGSVILFEVLGLHSIIAGFFAGFALSESIKSDIIKDKLHALSYGVFIPTFFVIVGANVALDVFVGAGNATALAITIVVCLLAVKFISSLIGGYIAGFSKNERTLIGVSMFPQLSTTLAAVFAGFELGLFDDKLLTSIIILSIVTTLISPFAIRQIAPRLALNENMI